MTKSVNPRELIVDMLIEITKNGEYSHVVIGQTLEKYQYLSKADRSFLKKVTNGTIEQMIYIDYILNHYSKVKVNKMKPMIRAILRSSVYQLYFMDRIPSSAVCNEAVKLTGKRGFQNLKGFVNGVLRTIIREGCKEILPPKERVAEYLSVKYSTPEWLVKQWMGVYGKDKTEQMLVYFLKEKNTTIRCNNSKITSIELKEKLMEDGVKEIVDTPLSYAFEISGYDYLTGLSSFREGLFAVQDMSSMLVAEAAGVAENNVCIDVCAAPGGKTLHVADKLGGTGKVFCGDISERKAEKIMENVERMGFENVAVHVWDATEFEEELKDMADIVLADVPCSGLGVIGRKPDIKFKMNLESMEALIPLQRKILTNVKNYVKPGGVLMFSTCTVNEKENKENVNWFVKEYPEFQLEDFVEQMPEIIKPLVENGKLQLLPGECNTDGFFIAKLRRKG